MYPCEQAHLAAGAEAIADGGDDVVQQPVEHSRSKQPDACPRKATVAVAQHHGSSHEEVVEQFLHEIGKRIALRERHERHGPRQRREEQGKCRPLCYLKHGQETALQQQGNNDWQEEQKSHNQRSYQQHQHLYLLVYQKR